VRGASLFSLRLVQDPSRTPSLKTRKKKASSMTRDEIKDFVLRVFQEEFEIESPGLDDDLRERFGFDSIDAIEMLGEIETLLNSELSQEEKKRAMDIRTTNQLLDYIESLARARE
jgi:acyl carrier protein